MYHTNAHKHWNFSFTSESEYIPTFRFFGIYSSVFGIFRFFKYRCRYRYRYFKIPRYWYRYTDPALIIPKASVNRKVSNILKDLAIVCFDRATRIVYFCGSVKNCRKNILDKFVCSQSCPLSSRHILWTVFCVL